MYCIESVSVWCGTWYHRPVTLESRTNGVNGEEHGTL